MISILVKFLSILEKKMISIISSTCSEEKNDLITLFVDNFDGIALIYDMNGNVAYGDEKPNISNNHVLYLNDLSNVFREKL